MATTKTRARANEVLVKHLPPCDLCHPRRKRAARYDAKTVLGSWAYCCQTCFAVYGVGGLGVGRGQKLVLTKDAA